MKYTIKKDPIHIIKMNRKLKVLTVAGTRPEIIRLSEIIKKFDQNFDHTLVYTGQNFSKELSNFFFSNFNIKPKIKFNIKNKKPIDAISEILSKTDIIIDKIKPDCFFVLGDTNSALSSLVAKKKKIPIFHYEAGNRCFDQRVPEEVNRRIIDTISDINLTYSANAKINLVKENFALDRVFNIGSPLKEVFEKNKEKIKKSKILQKLKIKKDEYILVSIHREENVDNKAKLVQIVNSLNFLASKNKNKLIVTLHPRTKKKFRKKKFRKNIKFFSPFDFFDYNYLQLNSSIVLSDSGSISEESYILNFPAINLRDTHERHEAMEKAIVPMSQFDGEEILSKIKILKKNNKLKKSKIQDYEQIDVSNKIVKIVSSYVNYVNRKIYYKFTK